MLKIPPPPQHLGGLLTDWRTAERQPLAGDASTRQYFRLRQGDATAILMDASRNRESLAPFIRLARHLAAVGFSVPAIFDGNAAEGLLLLEDFGDDSFARLLEKGAEPERLFALATDLLVALHQHPQAIPPGLRAYHPQQMLADIELFLEWRTPGLPDGAKAEFRARWEQVLPLAHLVPPSLLLRDYHVANLMLLPERPGICQAGLLDFQDAYQGPVTYDLVSLLEDARRDLPPGLRERMLARYQSHFPELDPEVFETSLAIVAAQRHTRVLAIFERLSRRDSRHDYRRLHSPRVEHLLKTALRHPALADVKRWFDWHVL